MVAIFEVALDLLSGTERFRAEESLLEGIDLSGIGGQDFDRAFSTTGASPTRQVLALSDILAEGWFSQRTIEITRVVSAGRVDHTFGVLSCSLSVAGAGLGEFAETSPPLFARTGVASDRGDGGGGNEWFALFFARGVPRGIIVRLSSSESLPERRLLSLGVPDGISTFVPAGSDRWSMDGVPSGV